VTFRDGTAPTSAAAAVAVALAVLPGSGGEALQPEKPRHGEAVPGGSERAPELRERLAAAWRARPAGYAPRTRHLAEDGSPLFTNRLFLETSPYLRQHAHNPVDWYPWGEEAFETARRLGRPILLSVGYSTCHWCHVMEEESFEDLEVARLVNEGYVAIKVDREERPDVDAIYMSAVQLLTGRGGWPMTVWLTPDREPFFGGTYFPPRDGDRGARVGFLTLLRDLRAAYDEQPEKVAATAARLSDAVRDNLAPRPGHGGTPGAEVLTRAVAQCEARFDDEHGGLQPAPKFPSSLPVRYLLRYHRRTGNQGALRMATRTLEKMAAGGMYDQVAGGFHRYSTDARWLVPHFEKMLYDNALLVTAYLEAFQATGREDFAEVARDVLRYLERDMASPEGAFYSATDADSLSPEGEREEGWFFTWTPDELEAVLGADVAGLVGAYWGVVPGGNFEGRSILHVPHPSAEVARERGVSEGELRERLAASRERLYAARAKRPAPIRDEKVLTAWNGLAVSAFARAALALGEPRYARVASRTAAFLLSHLRRDGRLMRSYKDGAARHAGYLDDYAFLTAGLLDLVEVTAEPRWLDEALSLDAVLSEHFEDREAGGFFMTADDHEELLAREKPAHDGAEPSGNSVHALNLMRLHELTGDDGYRRRAVATLGAFRGRLEGAPLSLSEMLLALEFHLDAAKQIVIVAPGSWENAEPLLAVLRSRFVPNRVLAAVGEGEELQALQQRIPSLEGKRALGGRTTAYVCRAWVCDRPTSDPEVFASQLGEVEPLPGGGDGGGL